MNTLFSLVNLNIFMIEPHNHLLDTQEVKRTPSKFDIPCSISGTGSLSFRNWPLTMSELHLIKSFFDPLL
jgi:hypothetical protein